MTNEEALEIVLDELADLEPYVYHRAATGSIYVKFKERRLRSLRIANHNGRSKYSYKWNLRSDISRRYDRTDKGKKRIFFPTSEIKIMCHAIQRYYEAIKKGDIMEKDLFIDPALFAPDVLNNIDKIIDGKKMTPRWSNVLPWLHRVNIIFAITKLVNSNSADEITCQLIQDHLYVASPETIREIVMVYLPELFKIGEVSSDGIPSEDLRKMSASYACFLEDIGIIK